MKHRLLWAWVFGGSTFALMVYLFYALYAISREDRVPANEMSAAATLRTLNTAELTYKSAYDVGFSGNLTRLCAPAAGGEPNVLAADLVDPVLCGLGPQGTPTRFVKKGYVFLYLPFGTPGAISNYTIQADPINRGQTGEPSFFTDKSQAIRANANRQATRNDKPI
jgi:type IV pilus assembly protein PilA